MSGCLDVVLTKNKVKIPDSFEGVWKLDDNLYEIRKKDDYWAFLKLISSDKEEETLDLTMHKIDGKTFICWTGWDDGKRKGIAHPIEINSEKKVTLYPFKMSSKQVEKDYRNTPDNLKETIFISYLKEGKLTIDKENEEDREVLEKVYSLKD